jgi:choloylglycine hydrolase
VAGCPQKELAAVLRSLRAFVCAATAACFAFATSAQACTSFMLSTKDGDFIYGRTMEFGFPLKSDVTVIPRAYPFRGTAGTKEPGMAWKSRYATVGMNAFGLPMLADGMNEKGLSGGILYFPGYAGYVAPEKADKSKAVAPWEFLTWALTNFATTAELKQGLSQVQIVAALPPMKNAAVPPFHYTFHDASGGSLVIEPVDGQLKVYDNPLGVLTNSPSFDWHMTNLRNYVKLSPVNAPPLKVNGMTIPSFGQGSGLLGVPGDPTPPSRFVRVLGMAMSAAEQPDGPSGVRMAEHIANNFDIPAGFIRTSAESTEFEITQWTVVADMRNQRYYVKMANYEELREVDLHDFDLDAKKVVTIPMSAALTWPKLMPPKN